MALRAFRATYLVAIDDEEAIQEEQRDEDAGPVTLEELKNYLKKSVYPVLDTENNGNECGVQSVEMIHEQLEELSADEIKGMYQHKAADTN